MFDTKVAKDLMNTIIKKDAAMDKLMDDWTDAGMARFEKLCDERDAAMDKLIRMMGTVGIDAKTARYMVMNGPARKKLIALFNRAA